jgi:hypothetical protein
MARFRKRYFEGYHGSYQPTGMGDILYDSHPAKLFTDSAMKIWSDFDNRNAIRNNKTDARMARQGYRRKLLPAMSNASRAGTRDSAPLTTQSDSRTYYRKRRRRNTRRVKRGRRFSRAVARYENRQLGARIHVQKGFITTAAAADAGTTFTAILGMVQDDGTQLPTLNDIITQMNAGNLSSSLNKHTYLSSGCLDISLIAAAANTAPIDLDCYLCYCKRDIPLALVTSNLHNFISTLSTTALTDAGVIPATDVGVVVGRVVNTFSAASIGWTPFSCPRFGQYFSVVSKKKILMTPGQSTHLQLKKNWRRTLRNATIAGVAAGTANLACMRGVTWFYLFNYNSVTLNGTSQPAANVYANWETYYNVKTLKDNEATISVIT